MLRRVKILYLLKHFGNMHPFKVLEIKAKDVDEQKRLVTFYYNAFNNVDSDKDVSLPGSHSKSQTENIKRIKHFKNHNFYSVPGVIKEMGEDGYGAWARSELLDTTIGRDTIEEYKAGAITEHSFGFEVVKSYENNNIRYIQEFKVWEVSSLTGWGANENTHMINMKNEKQAIVYLNGLLSLKKGNFSDEYFKQLESKIKEVENHIKSLLTEPPESTHKEPVIDINALFQKKMYNFFN